MVKLQNTFGGGKMNKDVDSRLMEPGDYRDALNFSASVSSGEDTGVLENSLSNKQLTSLTFGANPKTVGGCVDTTTNRLYWFVTSDTNDYVVEYDVEGKFASFILEDNNGVLNFNPEYLITGANVIIDSDNDARFLAWTDGLNPPRIINIDRAKAYGLGGFVSAEISVIKAPPLSPPSITLTNTLSDEENNISESFLRFSYRYLYLDGEVSALSPFTETAFLPKSFSYDYSTSSNQGMVNENNEVDITYNTGPNNVKAVQIVFKESGSSTVYVIDTFNKVDEGFADNTNQVFSFSNNRVYTALSSDQLARNFDAVPLNAKAQEVIGNRLVYGNYTENYDLIDLNGDKVVMDYSATVNSTAIVEGVPTRSLKSIRDYEIGIVYVDDQGRMTTVLTGTGADFFVPNSDSINQNEAVVTINHLAPEFASKFRFFIKQSKVDYETIVPSLFYQDGVYAWIKVEGNETDKFNEGDFIYIKSDSREILTAPVKTRVLDIVDQPVNFLDETITATVEQLSGTYFKIKPQGYRLNESDFSEWIHTGYTLRSKTTNNNFSLASGASYTYFEEPIYYGSTGLDDITITGPYSGTTDIRYQIDINALGLPDSFRWSDDDAATWSADIPITGAPQALNNGLTVTFANSTGHLLSDNWIVSAKSQTVTDAWNKTLGDDGAPGSFKRRAIVGFASKENVGPIIDESIRAGAVITINYDDTISGTTTFDNISYTQTFVSTASYSNIEEWFYGDNIIGTLTYPTSANPERVIFRRGDVVGETIEIDGRYVVGIPLDGMIMIFSSSSNYSGSGSEDVVRVNSGLNILELENNVIFETVPTNDNSELFYEIGRTYDINGSGYHVAFDGGDTTQSLGVPGVFTLPVFNCYSWGNGFESYKIRDLFNARSMKIDSRPSAVIENYRKNVRIADLTYSKPYEQSTNFNGLNEFNLSTGNFKQMDDKYASIQKLYSEDTNLIVYQEDKIHNVPFQKDILFDADGQGNIRESANVLGTQRAYAGEYGISKNPESFAVFGNAKYNVDSRRGAVIRLSIDGITEISEYGMGDWFSDRFRIDPNVKRLGAYDLREGQYTLHMDDTDLTPLTIVPVDSLVSYFNVSLPVSYLLRSDTTTVAVAVSYVVSGGNIDLEVLDGVGGASNSTGSVTGSGTLNFNKALADTELLPVNVTIISGTPTFTLIG